MFVSESNTSESLPSSASLPDRLSAVYKKLAASADALSQASDELARPIRQVELLIQQLNIGLDTWVKIASGADDDNDNYWRREVGYVKFWSGWELAIRRTTGSRSADQESSDTWPFNEAPRSLRIEAFDKLPELLEELINNADKTAKKLREKTQEAQAVSAILKQTAADVKDEKEAAKQQKKERR